MNELLKAMDDILTHETVDRHSFFQLHYFLIGKEPTTQAKLWRCVRELEARKDSIEAVTLEIEDTTDKIALINLDTPIPYDGQDKAQIEKEEILKRSRKRKIDSLQKTVTTLKKKLKSLEEESNFLVETFNTLEKIEKIKPFDDKKSQEEYWNEKLTQELMLRNLLRQPIDVELMKTVLSLDEKVPIKQSSIKMLAETQEYALKMAENKKLPQ